MKEGNFKKRKIYCFIFYFVIFIILICKSDEKCGTFNPRQASQCYTYNDSNSLCCFLSRFEGPNKLFVCHRIPYNHYSSVMEHGFIKLGQFIYDQIDCGQSVGVNCSINIPLTPEDCYQYNLSDNYCCLVQAPEKDKRCVYSGASVNADYTTDTGIRIRCGSF